VLAVTLYLRHQVSLFISTAANDPTFMLAGQRQRNRSGCRLSEFS